MNTQLLKQHLASSLSDLASALDENPKSKDTDKLVLRVLRTGPKTNEDLIACISDVSRELKNITCDDSLCAEVNLNSLYGEDEEDGTCIRCLVLDGLTDIVKKADSAFEDGRRSTMMDYVYQTLKGLDTSDSSMTAQAMKEMSIVSSMF